MKKCLSKFIEMELTTFNKIFSLRIFPILHPSHVVRFQGDSASEDLLNGDYLIPTSLDNDFQLSEMSRFQNNTRCVLNDDTRRLQHQLDMHSPAKVHLPSDTQIRQSRKNMIESIDYVISNGDISHNTDVAKIWEELEKVIQEKQMLVRNIVMTTTKTPVENGLEWPALTSTKSKVIKRYKGITG